jgi:hypothetical protein
VPPRYVFGVQGGKTCSSDAAAVDVLHQARRSWAGIVSCSLILLDLDNVKAGSLLPPDTTAVSLQQPQQLLQAAGRALPSAAMEAPALLALGLPAVQLPDCDSRGEAQAAYVHDLHLLRRRCAQLAILQSDDLDDAPAAGSTLERAAASLPALACGSSAHTAHGLHAGSSGLAVADALAAALHQGTAEAGTLAAEVCLGQPACGERTASCVRVPGMALIAMLGLHGCERLLCRLVAATQMLVFCRSCDTQAMQLVVWHAQVMKHRPSWRERCTNCRAAAHQTAPQQKALRRSCTWLQCGLAPLAMQPVQAQLRRPARFSRRCSSASHTIATMRCRMQGCSSRSCTRQSCNCWCRAHRETTIRLGPRQRPSVVCCALARIVASHAGGGTQGLCMWADLVLRVLSADGMCKGALVEVGASVCAVAQPAMAQAWLLARVCDAAGRLGEGPGNEVRNTAAMLQSVGSAAGPGVGLLVVAVCSGI